MSYRWHEEWAKIPGPIDGKARGKTHGVCVAQDGRVIVFHQGYDGILHFDRDGQLIDQFGGEAWLGAHGLTHGNKGGQEYLWLTDQFRSVAVKASLEGEVLEQLPTPAHKAYESEKYVPTWAAEHPVDDWVYVADGYGASLVHVFDEDRKHVDTWDGTAGAGRFKEPHGIACREVNGDVEVWVTDRANHRIQIYNETGGFLRDSHVCHSPDMFDFRGSQVLIPELFTGIKICDVDSLTLIEEIGQNPLVHPHADPDTWWPPQAPEGWPNIPRDQLQAGQFNSPHGACFAPNGDIYVVEWIVGGRITRLEYLDD